MTTGQDWSRIEEVTAALLERLPVLAEEIVQHILEEVPGYGTAATVTIDDLRVSVSENLRVMLTGTAERRGPDDAELLVRRELGRRRAQQGLPVDALIQAYLVGYKDIWASLVREARPIDGRTAELLFDAVTIVWEWVHRVTLAIAAAHADEVRAGQARLRSSRRNFLELLLTRTPGDTTLEAAARLLGFEPAGRFCAVVAASSPEFADQEDLGRGLHSGVVVGVHRGQDIVAIFQGVLAETVVDVLRQAGQCGAVGVGVERPGLAGARSTVSEAEQALAVAIARRIPLCNFEEMWLPCLALAHEEQLDAILARGGDVAGRFPHLAAAVSAFANSGFSIAASSRALHLSPTSVKHRLDRWSKLTGWDVRTVDGVVNSLAAIDRYRAPR